MTTFHDLSQKLRRYAHVLGSACVLLGGAVLRFFSLGKQGLFLDEAWSWATAALPLPKLIGTMLTDFNPPFYFILLKGWMGIFSTSEESLRALSVVFSLLTLAAILIFASRWWGSQSAIFAGVFFAFSSFDIYYAQETRMFTMLSLLWFLGCALLVEAVQSDSRWFIPWACVSVMLSWTQYYGLVVAYVHLAFILAVLFLRERGIGRLIGVDNAKINKRWLSLATAILILGTLPLFYTVWKMRATSGGSSWIPKPVDISYLFVLISVGLTAARSYFLDSPHLTLTFASGIPLWIWFIVGFLLCGGFVVLALTSEWRKAGWSRWRISVFLVSLSIPLIIFGLANLFAMRLWALKVLLSIAPVLYLFAGLGLSRVRRGIQLCVMLLAVALSSLSLIPYFTMWSKADTHLAFQNFLPRDAKNEILIVYPAYLSPLVFYYLPEQVEVIGITQKAGGGFMAYSISPTGVVPETKVALQCDDPAVQQLTSLWIYASAPGKLKDVWQEWPVCLRDKKMHLFENGEWRPFP